MPLRRFICVCLFLFLSGTIGSAERITEAKIEALKAWADECGITYSYHVDKIPGYGLAGIADHPIQVNETLFSIPRSCLVMTSDIEESGFLKESMALFKDKMEFSPLLLWLMQESKNPESYYKAYFDVVPDSFPEHLLSWSDAELGYLKGTGLDISTRNKKNRLQHIFSVFSELLVSEGIQIPEWNFERFLWAYQSINTRSWGAVYQGEDQNILIPYADTVNHKPGTAIAGLTADFKTFSVRATEEYQPGEQVFQNYGEKSNHQLMASYGFLLEDNPNDFLTIQYELKPTRFVHSISFKELKNTGINLDGIKLERGKLPVDILIIERVSALNVKDLDSLPDVLQGKRVSIENEFQAIRRSINSLKNVLASYPTSLEEDKALLRSDSLSDNIRNAVLLAKSQKQLLLENIKLLEDEWVRCLDWDAK